jgi:voltage-dependent potassium channel beta subunit
MTEVDIPNHKMYYRMLGNTGLQVSVLSYGFWATFGAKEDLTDEEGIAMAKKCLLLARDNGVNLFDNAETYGNPVGEAERIMGEAMRQLREEDPVKWRRSDVIVTTKIFWGGSGVNEKGLSRKHISEGLTASLSRLQLDYVDLVFCHRPDSLTPTETVVRAMTEIVRQGKATAWGTSEWSAQQITEAVWIARTYGLEPPQFEQPQYHMFHRERFETEYKPLYQQPYNLGTTIWSPLASGLLTGKYNDTIPEGSRLTTKGYGWLNQILEKWRAEGKIEKVRSLTKYASECFQCTVSQLALAWCIKNKNVSTVLLGATKPEQLLENFGCLSVAERMTDADMSRIDEILGNVPPQYAGYTGQGGSFRSIDTI